MPYLQSTAHPPILSSVAIIMSAEKLPNDLDKSITPTEAEHVEVLAVDPADSENPRHDGSTDLETGDGGAYSTVSLIASSLPSTVIVSNIN